MGQWTRMSEGQNFHLWTSQMNLWLFCKRTCPRIACGGVKTLPSIFHVPDASERFTVAPGWNEPRQGSSPAMWRSSSTMALGCTSAASKVFRIPNPPKRWFVWRKHARIESAPQKKSVFPNILVLRVRQPNVAQAISSTLNIWPSTSLSTSGDRRLSGLEEIWRRGEMTWRFCMVLLSGPLWWIIMNYISIYIYICIESKEI